MTKAYIAGFCKKAEEYGINTNALMKLAMEKMAQVVQKSDESPYARWDGLTKDEQKYYDRKIFPHWYSRVNPVNYLIQGLATYAKLPNRGASKGQIYQHSSPSVTNSVQTTHPVPPVLPAPPKPSAPDNIDISMPKLPLPKAPDIKPYIKPNSK